MVRKQEWVSQVCKQCRFFTLSNCTMPVDNIPSESCGGSDPVDDLVSFVMVCYFNLLTMSCMRLCAILMPQRKFQHLVSSGLL